MCGLWASAHVRHCGSCERKAAMPIRCLIVDDNSGFRQEMGGLLKEQGVEVVGGAASAAEALQQIAELRPDVALIDIYLGDPLKRFSSGRPTGQIGRAHH